ncbi:MAG: hypothetical protein KF760_08145 [Candidatus Eremiobacteraeota bacterium]|nr:hypothetical protein [Candidatus Eremiobacteraeota bacterium]MCW5867961.1 hypothetical protein [Candidatus Eremiobacteraeota bacterium]
MARIRNVQGVALMGVLLTLVLLLVLGMGYLSQQLQRYRSSVQVRLRLEAQQLAELGWRETQLKLLKDSNFPPSADPDQSEFSFSETIRDSAGKRRGFYHVSIDRRFALRERLLSIQCQGEVCPDGEEHDHGLARYLIKAEWDLAQPARRVERWVMVDSGSW